MECFERGESDVWRKGCTNDVRLLVMLEFVDDVVLIAESADDLRIINYSMFV